MNTAIRTTTAAWALGLILGLATTAQAQAPNPLAFTGTLNPAVGGWISPETNFGGITFDLIYDPTRPVVAGQWQFQVNGVAKDVFFQADMDYRTQDEYISTGIFATLDSPTFTFTGRADYSNPVYGGGGTAVMTGRNIRIEFASSRTGTFIDNPGQPDERRFPIVSYLRGLPLVAPTDYSGEWLFAWRTETQSGPNLYHNQNLAKLVLTPYVLGNFRSEDPFHDLYQAVVPEPGARIYSVECTSLLPAGAGNALSACDQWEAVGVGCATNIPLDQGGCFGLPIMLLWVNPDETGAIAKAARDGSGTTHFYAGATKQAAVYSGNQNLIVRKAQPAYSTVPKILTEGVLARVPAGVITEPFSQ